MDEKIKINHEHQRNHEHDAESAPGHEKAASHAEHAKHHQEKLEHIRAKAEKAAESTETVKHRSHEQEDTSHKPADAFVNKELKELAYARTLARVRHQLSPIGRFTSKVIHQPAVNAVSEFTGKTVGRPSGLLGGGLVAFIGTTVYFYITKHYGYEYSFTVFLVLLIGGFISGWLFEMFYRLLRPTK